MADLCARGKLIVKKAAERKKFRLPTIITNVQYPLTNDISFVLFGISRTPNGLAAKLDRQRQNLVALWGYSRDVSDIPLQNPPIYLVEAVPVKYVNRISDGRIDYVVPISVKEGLENMAEEIRKELFMESQRNGYNMYLDFREGNFDAIERFLASRSEGFDATLAGYIYENIAASYLFSRFGNDIRSRQMTFDCFLELWFPFPNLNGNRKNNQICMELDAIVSLPTRRKNNYNKFMKKL